MKLPIRLKYYSGGWKWMEYDPSSVAFDEKNPKKYVAELKKYTENFRKDTMLKLGALNVIDNTTPVLIGTAKSGDLIMSKWNPEMDPEIWTAS
jgi:hypothetical protein